jgi:hypothetical protein
MSSCPPWDIVLLSLILLLLGFADRGFHAQASTTLSLFNSTNDLPSAFDIQSVSTPNAWLEVTLAGLALKNPGQIQKALEDLGNGSVGVALYEDTVLKPPTVVQKRLWQPESNAGGAVWVAAFQDAMIGLFPYQDDPAWSPYCSLQAATAITGGTANLASCDSVSSIVTVANFTIAITSRDIEGNEHNNNTIAVLGTGGGVSGIANSGVVSSIGFDDSSHQMVQSLGEQEQAWLQQCNWLQYC